MSHHLDEPTGYSAGYAAHSHPDFRDPTDDSYGREYEDLENSYHAAGGTGPDFEEGVNDAANGISHKLDDPENYYGYQAEEAAWRKRNRDSVYQQQQDKHNKLREQGDITDFHIHEGPEFPGMPGVKSFDYSPRYSPWKSEKHPEGSWEGCPTCSDNGYGPKPVDYSDPDDNIDPFDPRLLGASRTAGDVPLWADWQHDPAHETSNPDGRAETYRADINDDHHMTVFRKNPSEVYDDDDDSDYARAEREYPHPVNMDTPWSYHVHGVGHNDNPYLKFHTPYDDNPYHTGFPDMETAQRAAESAYKTFAPGDHGSSLPDPDEQQDPFDPRLMGASRTASVYDWKQYTPGLVKELQDGGLWDGTGVDQRSWETRSDAGDHYYIRPAGSVVNTLDHDHPMKHDGDPTHWEVDHLPPEYGHDPEGYFGDIYGPTALNKYAEPVEGVHPHGFSSPEHAMDWVKSRHPEESFDPDDKQDPFDPRLMGASRLDPADIYRLAGDGLSYEDTMKLIDEQLAAGEADRHHDWDSDYSVPEPGVERLNPVELNHSGVGDGLQCDHCQGQANNAFEVNHASVGDDYKGKFCDGCLRDLVPSWYGNV
jgi:hypothetical protein